MRNFKRALILIASAIILIVFGLSYMQKKLIFLPTKLNSDYKFEFVQSFDELFLETDDGARLNALHFLVDNPKGVILYFHGNAGDLSRWGNVATYFTNFQYDVLIMDYRTYGKSSGRISEKKLLEDAQLFYDHLLKSYNENRIIIYGRSLGTTFATYIASNNNPKKLILETPFFNLTEVAQDRIPFIPVKYFLRYQFPTNEFIIDVDCPVYIFHGTNDKVVPFQSGKRLSELVDHGSLNFIPIEGGEHNNLVQFEDYKLGIQEALD